MKKFVVAAAVAAFGFVGSAVAADMPTKAYSAPVAAPSFSWTGFYVGAHVGSGWGTSEQSNYTFGGAPLPFGNDQVNVSGFLGGVQGGLQLSMETVACGWHRGDFSWADVKGTNGCLGIFLPGSTCGGTAKWTGDVTGRVGFTSDRALIYVKGGVAWVNADYTYTFAPAAFATTTNNTRTGALLGVGVEYAITRNWSAKVEYNYIDLQDNTITYNTAPIFGLNATADSRTTLNVIKFGANYRF